MKTQNKPVTKLIIPLAGFGTRFLPTSKNYPKEMINLVDKPVIQYLIEEAYASGIKEVIFVLNYSKKIIPDYFSKRQDPHQAKAYRTSATAQENLKEFQSLLKGIKFRVVQAATTLGDGHSVLLARKYIKPNEPFAVTMGDLLSPPGNGKPFLKQLIEIYDKRKAPVVSVESIPRSEVGKYGVVAPQKSMGRLHLIRTVVEKPKPENAPSTLILTGKYILTGETFKILEKLVKGHQNGEVHLADALTRYSEKYPLYAYECMGKIMDTGNKLDFLKATVMVGLEHPTFGKQFKSFLKSKKLS